MDLNADMINGALEALSAGFVLWNVRRLLIDKMIAGISLVPVVFFDAWGFWNMYYYPSLDQWWSFAGGVLLVAANVWWTSLAFYYGGKRAKDQQGQTGSAIEFDATGVREVGEETAR